MNFIGIVENFSSLLWTRKFFEAGHFKILCPATDVNIDLLKKHRLIEKPDSVEIGFITSIDIEISSESGEFITASGIFLSGLLSNRIIFDADAGDDLFTVIDKQMGENCKNSVRRIDKLKFDRWADVPAEYTVGQRFYNLAEYASAVCRAELCGLCVRLIHEENPYLLLTVSYGNDLSIEQDVNPQVVFSTEFDNLISAEYHYSDDTAVNTVYGFSTAADDVDGILPEYLHGDENCGFDRMETAFSVGAVTYTTKSMIFKGYDAEGSAIWVEEDRKRVDYTETLKLLHVESGNRVREISESMSGEVDFKSGYKVHYDLGDIVTVYDKKWGILLNQRIYEVSEFYENGAVKIEPVFGSPLRTIADFLDTT